MTSQEQTDKIIAYLRQELSRKEQAVFENEIAANPDLKQEVAEHRDALKVLDIHSETFLKNKLQGFREQRRWKRKRWRRFAMAASFGAVFLFVATFYTLQRNQYSDSKLAYSGYEFVPKGQRSDSTANRLYEQAKAQFYANDYDATISILKEWLARTPVDQKARLFLGETYLTAKNPDSAIVAFSKVSKEPDYDLFERAEISTARARLALGETEKAREQLLFIAENTSHSYKKEAQKILDKLDSFWRKLP